MVGIDEQRVGARPVGDGAHVREIDLLCRPQMMDERAGRGDGGGVAVEAEAFEPAGLQLRRAASGAPIPSRTSTRRCAVSGMPSATIGRGRRRAGGHDQLAGLEHGDFVGERLQAVGALVFSRA